MASRDYFLKLDGNYFTLLDNDGSRVIIQTVRDLLMAPIVRTHYQSDALSVVASDPLVRSDRTYSKRLTAQINNYSHESRAIGGFYSAQIEINDSQQAIEDWIEDGLGRHIETFDPDLCIVWEGFVNKISARLGPLQFDIGPLLDIGNRVSVVYSSSDDSTDPPTVGVRTTTAPANDLVSQAAYGIIEKVLSVGGASATVAEQARDTWLNENRYPETSRKTSLGDGGLSLSLSCLGYWHFLNYIYTSTTTGSQNLSDKIEAVLAADPNGIFSTDYSRISSNTIQVDQYDNKDRRALAIIKGLNSLGDASDNRYNIGIYGGRQMVYEVAPQFFQYQQRLTGNQGVTDQLNNVVKPWDVDPAEWIMFSDFLAGRLPPSSADSLQSDPRTGFIETIKYTAPWGLDINGQKIGELDQVLAKAGIKGVGA